MLGVSDRVRGYKPYFQLLGTLSLVTCGAKWRSLVGGYCIYTACLFRIERGWFVEHHPLPSQATDLKPIEHVWDDAFAIMNFH